MHLKPISYELRRELYNRDHPWRSGASDNENNAAAYNKSSVEKKRKKRRKLKKLHAKRKLMSKKLGASNWNAKINISFSSTTNNSPVTTNNINLPGLSSATNTTFSPTTSLLNNKLTTKKIRKKSPDSPVLPLAYQKIRSDTSSDESSASSPDYSNRSRLPSPFRDIFPLKKRPTNGFSSANVVEEEKINLINRERYVCILYIEKVPPPSVVSFRRITSRQTKLTPLRPSAVGFIRGLL